jgi:hypothetical protein
MVPRAAESGMGHADRSDAAPRPQWSETIRPTDGGVSPVSTDR